MRKIFFIAVFCANMAMAMLPPQVPAEIPAEEQLLRVYAHIEVVNRTKHNLFITDMDAENIIIRLKAGEAKKAKNIDLTGHHRYAIVSLTKGTPKALGGLVIIYDSATEEYPKHIDSLIIVNLQKYQGTTTPLQTIGSEYIRIDSRFTPQAPERIDVTLKIILEGDDLGQSRIEDLTGVVH